MSAEAVKASGDMRRCLEALGENPQNVKKTAVMLELLVRLVIRNDDCIGAAFFEHGGMTLLGAILRKTPQRRDR